MSTDRPFRRPEIRATQTRLPTGPAWRVSALGSPRVFWFGKFEYDVLQALDGRSSLDAVARRLGCHSAADRAKIGQLVDRMVQAGLVSVHRGAGLLADQADLERRRELHRGQLEVVPIRDLDESWAAAIGAAPTSNCASCGLLCCSYHVDLSDAEAMPLLVEATERAGLRPAEVLEDRRPYGPEVALVTLRRSEETDDCALLSDDGRCAVHRDEGPQVKPVACQLYPGVPILTPDGPRLGLRVGCTRPGSTSDEAPVAAFGELLGRLRQVLGGYQVRRAPETVRVGGERVVPWTEWADFEREARALIAAATSAAEAIDRVARALIARFDVAPSADADDSHGRRIAGTLSTVVTDIAGPAFAAPLEAVASGVAPSSPRPAPAAFVRVALDALEPLRFETALAGLGVLRLLVAAVDRDAEGTSRPLDTTARWLRKSEHPRIHEALARSDLSRLEALATDAAL